jgi:hypothetical protein
MPAAGPARENPHSAAPNGTRRLLSCFCKYTAAVPEKQAERNLFPVFVSNVMEDV